MLIGARGRRLALFDEAHLARQVALRGTDLLVFWMGGNDVSSEYFNRDLFVRDYGAGIDAARAERPEVSCLVVSVMDMGQRPGGRTRRRVPSFVELQRELAFSRGCAFMNFYEAMGGSGTMARWRRRSDPWVSADYSHPTYAGAGEVGELFSRVLLRSLAEHLGQL
jgi:lysophospholipase L1-like esterase